MIKFGSALALSALAMARETNRNHGNGTITLEAQQVVSEKGGLADVLIDTGFTHDLSNQSYLFADYSSFFKEESPKKK